MFDKKEYDLEVQKVREQQIQDLSDYLAEYIKKNASIRDMKVFSPPSEEELNLLRDTPIPRVGRDPKEVADELVKNVFETSMLIQHPRFFSFVSSAVSPYSLAGSVLADIYNVHGGGWEESPGGCLIEEKLIKWMASLAGYNPDDCGGVFVSGGSMANMSALIAARDNILDEYEFGKGVAYLSDQTHSSVNKGLRMIGFRKDQIRIIESDDDFKIRTDLLEEQIIKDINDGLKPFVVVGTLGTTNTGSIDPFEKISEICNKYHMWFHVDAAFGGSILLSDIYRNYAKGIELSDSFSWDTHKWAMQVYSCSCIIAKNKNHLIKSFAEHPEYLEDIRSASHTDPWDLGPELTRPHRALKLWFTVQAMGTEKLADVIDYAFFNAKLVEKELLKRPNWRIESKPMCGAINFRYYPDGLSEEKIDKINLEISNKINADGYTYIVTTIIKNKRVLRMCVINANTNDYDIIETIEYLDNCAKEIMSKIR